MTPDSVERCGRANQPVAGESQVVFRIPTAVSNVVEELLYGELMFEDMPDLWKQRHRIQIMWPQFPDAHFSNRGRFLPQKVRLAKCCSRIDNFNVDSCWPCRISWNFHE